MNKRGDGIPGRFDTALINDGTGEETGIEGMYIAIVFEGAVTKIWLTQGTVLVVSVLSSHFHLYLFLSSLTSMLRFLSILSMFNGFLSLLYKALI